MSGIGEDEDREDDLSPDMPGEKQSDYFGIGDEPKIKDPNVQDTDDGGAIVTLDDEDDEDEEVPIKFCCG